MTQPQPYVVMTQPQPYSVADVLCEAPTLLALLSSQDWAALSSCGRQLWHLIHSLVTVITVHKVRTAEALLTGNWPQLALITVQPTAQLDLRLPQDSNFQLIASISSSKHGQCSTAFVVSPNTQLDQGKSIAAAFTHLQISYSNKLMIFVHSCDEEVMAQIAQLPWPCLTNLSLQTGRLNCVSKHQLAAGFWPELETLDLSGNSIAADPAVAAFIGGKWPLLTSMDLSSNSSLGPAAVALVPKQ